MPSAPAKRRGAPRKGAGAPLLGKRRKVEISDHEQLREFLCLTMQHYVNGAISKESCETIKSWSATMTKVIPLAEASRAQQTKRQRDALQQMTDTELAELAAKKSRGRLKVVGDE